MAARAASRDGAVVSSVAAKPRDEAATPEPGGRARRAARLLVRDHWLLLTLLVAGASVRLVAQFAYRPALIFWDSPYYLHFSQELSPGLLRPAGYPAFLRLLPLRVGLWVIPLAQHLLGLALAVGIYVLLLRLNTKRWIAAVATAPVLFDSFQLNLEQQILSETLFQALLLGGAAVLVWQRRPTAVYACAAGLLFGAAVLVRVNALTVIGPALLAILFLKAGRKAGTALVLAFAAPVVAYAMWFQTWHGYFGLMGYGGHALYARVAQFVDCEQVRVPPEQRVLCPAEPLGQRHGASWYRWHANTPIHNVKPPPGTTADAILGDFTKRAILAQPWTFTRYVLTDFFRGFSLKRVSAPGEEMGTIEGARVDFWRFKPFYPIYGGNTDEIVWAYDRTTTTFDPSLASFLIAYQSVANTPGPLMLAAMLAAFAAALGIGRAHMSPLRPAAFLFASLTVAVLLPGAMHVFSWRYQIAQLVLLPPAGAIAWNALSGRNDETPELAD